MYYYIKNLQGDIVRIVDSSGTMVVNYSYNVWGKLLSVTNGSGAAITDTTHIAYLNPLRYRGYVYDDETGLYYLQSRYYDPTICRFINADIYCDTLSGSPLSTNMFAYCENCPLLRYDKSGKDAWWIQAENSVNGLGHTSILIEESVNRWWYLYWSDESIQLFFLGCPNFSKLNKYINRFIKVFNKRFKEVNISYFDEYTKAIRFYGNFYQSFIEARYLFRSREFYNKTKVYKLKFNPEISDEHFNDLINSSLISFDLADRTHQRYRNTVRPESLVIMGNETYDTWSFNCMHLSAAILMYGTHKYNQTLFYNTMSDAFHSVLWPNWVYIDVFKAMGRKESYIWG